MTITPDEVMISALQARSIYGFVTNDVELAERVVIYLAEMDVPVNTSLYLGRFIVWCPSDGGGIQFPGEMDGFN